MQRSYTNRQIWALLIPLIAESVLTCLMGTVDAMMVSNAGADAISAVSLVDTLNILIVQVFTALATGGTVICAQLLGRGDRAEAVESAKQLQLAVCSAAALLAAITIVLHGPLLRLLFGSVEDSVMQGCRTYFVVTALSFPFLALYSGGAGIYRSCGNSRLPMTLSLISNGMNVIGNAVLIFGFHMGVLGVAIPTLVSRMFSGIAIMLLLRRPGQPLTLRHWRGLRFSWPRIGRMMRIGVPNGIENGMFQFGKLIIQSTISAMGTAAIAANAITTQLQALSSQAAIGVQLGSTTVIGTCMGAGKADEARYWIKRLTLYAQIGVTVLCLLMIVIGRPVTVLAGLSRESADLAVWMNNWVHGYKLIPWVLAFIPVAGMRAAGDVKFAMITSTITMWTCRVAVVLLLANVFHLGPIAMWIGMFCDWTVRAVIFTFRFFSNKWTRFDVLRLKK